MSILMLSTTNMLQRLNTNNSTIDRDYKHVFIRKDQRKVDL